MDKAVNTLLREMGIDVEIDATSEPKRRPTRPTWPPWCSWHEDRLDRPQKPIGSEQG